MIVNKWYYGFIVAVVLLAAIGLGSQEQSTQSYETSKCAYFSAGQLTNVKQGPHIAVPSRLPDTVRPAPSSEYRNIVKSFVRWTHYMIVPDNIPPDNFIENHIRLFKACKETGNADMAFLAYTIRGKNYMIVQTAGRFALFVEDQSQSSRLAAPDAEQKLRTAVDEIILPARRKRIPAMKLQRGEAISEMRAGTWMTVIYYFAGNEACLYFEKDMLKEGPQPAHIPLENEWFAYMESLKH